MDLTVGEVVGYESFFSDPYRNLDSKRRRQTYATSWLDSGINALSVAVRFLSFYDIVSVTSIDAQASVYEAQLRFQSGTGEGTGTIRTSWDVAEPAKTSTLIFESGARLSLDHQQISGELVSADGIVDVFRYSGQRARLALHYRNAFESLFGKRDESFNVQQSKLLHRLLLSKVVM